MSAQTSEPQHAMRQSSPSRAETGLSEKDHLFDEIIEPACSTTFAATHELRRPSDLSRTALIHTTTRSEFWRNWFEAYKIAPSAEVTLGLSFQHFYIAIQAAISGLGVALVPKILVVSNVEDNSLVTPVGSPYQTERTYSLVRNPNSHPSAALDAFCDWLKEKVSAQVNPFPD